MNESAKSAAGEDNAIKAKRRLTALMATQQIAEARQLIAA